eukprot:gene7542-10277_t
MPSFDVSKIRSKAEELLRQNNNTPDDSRMLYAEEIMDWTDYFTENFPSSFSDNSFGTETLTNMDIESSKIFDAIIDLWLSYTSFEISLHQFKKAVQVYDDALNDRIAQKSVKIYISYADFCVERKKLSNAQKVYIRGLCAGLDSIQSNILWDKFLKITHKINNSTDLTLNQLYNAVITQLQNENTINISKLAIPSEIASNHVDNNNINVANSSAVPQDNIDVNNNIMMINNEVSVIESKADDFDMIIEPAQANVAQLNVNSDQMVFATSEDIDISKIVPVDTPLLLNDDQIPLPQLENIDEFTIEQILRIFNQRPIMLFSSFYEVYNSNNSIIQY